MSVIIPQFRTDIVPIIVDLQTTFHIEGVGKCMSSV